MDEMLRSLRREALFIGAWSAAVLSLAVACLLLYRPFVASPTLLDLVRGVPQPLAAVFDLRGITRPSGFVEATLFGLVIPIAFMSVGIGIGSRAFVHGVPNRDDDRVRVSDAALRRRGLVLVVCGVLAVTLIVVIALVIAPAAGGVDVLDGEALTATAALTLLALVLGFIALLVARGTGRVGVAAAVATLVALLADTVNGFASAIPGVRALRYLSPVYYAEAGHPLAHGVPFAHLAVLAAGAVALGAAVAFGRRRDRGPTSRGPALR